MGTIALCCEQINCLASWIDLRDYSTFPEKVSVSRFSGEETYPEMQTFLQHQLLHSTEIHDDAPFSWPDLHPGLRENKEDDDRTNNYNAFGRDSTYH